MKMELILQKKLHRLYEENSDIMMRLGNFLEPEFEGIIDAFYTELMEIPEIASILKNMIFFNCLQINKLARHAVLE